MKNLLCLLAFMMAGPVFAQTTPKDSTTVLPDQKLSLALYGGLNMSNMPFLIAPMTVEGFTVETQQEYAYFAGFSARKPFGRHYAGLLESQFTIKGFSFKNTPLGSRYRFHYLDIIPQFEYKAFKNLYVSLGPYWGIRLEERIKSGDEPWVTTDPDFFEYADDFDFGAVGGLSVRFNRFYALFRYQHGLGSVNDQLVLTDENGQIIQSKQRNRSLQVGIGFRML